MLGERVGFMKRAGKLHCVIIDVESRYLEPLSQTDGQTEACDYCFTPNRMKDSAPCLAVMNVVLGLCAGERPEGVARYRRHCSNRDRT